MGKDLLLEISEEIKEEIEEEKAEETLRDIPQGAPEESTDHHETPVNKRRIALPLFIFFIVLVAIAMAVMSLQDHPPGSSLKENSKPEITLTSPINGITGIHPDRMTLKWIGKDSDGDEISYKVYFGETSNPGYASTTHSNQVTITNKDWGKKYYWRVQASDNYGGTTTSQVYSFTTQENKAPIIQSNPSPSDKATNQQLTLTLGWICNDPDGDTVTYDVYFGTNSNPKMIVEDQSENMFTVSNLIYGTTYYWKIIAKESKGATTEGPIWKFTTRSNEAPKAPSNPSPLNGWINQLTSVSLSWQCNDPDGDSITYDVYFGTGSNPSTKISSNQTDNKLNKSNLSQGTTYYWKVVAKDSKGATTEGPIWRFTTRSNEAPKAPSNPSPTNDSINQPLVLSLSWDCDDADGDSVTYDVYFGTSSDLRVKESTGNSAKSINKSGLSYNTTYYWKVVAKDSKGATTEGPIWKFTTSKVPEGMVLVEKGSFIMGDSSGLGFDRERPAHEVIIDYEFAIGKYEITFDEYDVFCRDSNRESANDEGWGRGRRPVINVTWYDAVAYCNWLSESEGLPKAYDENGKLLDKNGRVTDDPSEVLGYRLPTEAEWEYVAKGGNSISFHRYSGGDEVGKVAWYYSNSFGKTHEVGKKTCNELGLFDMSGNVWEWCSDSYNDDFYSRSSGKNPYNNEISSFRVSRGGGFSDSANYLRVESRFYYNTLTAAKDLGFRICRTVF
ncbi:SUMF1/EgtB/PvdO family nonheme iron enzyme [Mesotoga sp. TolDC]|uniref:SUMF1/EgtB/PvdO family nonheme iron enzyme n=1 Tax=Mesotoga sp. TolDC TaxID=1389250 RepID=UPI0021ACA183|nr:SUMF1/EgtB/PvdO family nonheme iron enzyme [Mesotoga sp. TolDC]